VTTEIEMMRLLERADPVRRGNAAPTVDAAQYLERLIARDRVVAVDLAPVDEASSDESVVDMETSPREHGSRHRWLIAAAAVAAVFVVAASIFVQRNSNGGVSTVPTDSTAGSTSPAPTTTTVPLVAPAERLPAEGTTLSTPETGELVAAAAQIHRGGYWLYADGRLIGINDADYPNRMWFEQRLGPAGVEAVRQAFLATGMFDPGQPATEVPAPPPVPGGCMCVRDDDGRMLARTDLSHGLDPHDVDPALEEVLTYFEELESRIPDDWWVDREIKHYAAARYSISFIRRSDPNDANTNEAVDANAARALLPAPAAELLTGQEPRTLEQLANDKSAYPGDSSGFSPNAFVVPTDVARAFAEQFPEALTEGPAGPAYGFWWTIAVTEPEATSLTIMMWPMHPHGEVAMWGG
jgi:hypothetical protein